MRSASMRCSRKADFCHNIARSLPIRINDPPGAVTPHYTATVGEMARLIETFRISRDALMTERVGTGFVRALYATYVSHLPPESFAYTVPQHGDARGVFVEMLKTPRLRAVLVLYRASGRDPRRALPPHQDGEVPGDQGRGALQVPPHADRRDPRAGDARRQGRDRRDRAGLEAHPAYRQAKAGGKEAALELVLDVAVAWLYEHRDRFAPGLLFVAPHAQEATGDNAIPQTLAAVCAAIFQGQVDTEIVQSDRVYHTGADPMERMAARA